MTVSRNSKRILLHVGPHKTGSTSIQETLDSHRKRLRSYDIHYLGIGSEHGDLYSAFLDKPWEWHRNRRNGLGPRATRALRLLTLFRTSLELRTTRCKTVIISAEQLSMLPKHNLLKLKSFLEKYAPVSVIYYCRDIHEWLATDTQQAARTGIITEPTSYRTAIRRYLDFPANFIEVFGRDNVCFVDFEAAIESGLTNSLLNCGDLPSLDSMGMEEIRRNESISQQAVECFFTLNKIKPLPQHPRNKRLQAILESIPGAPYTRPGLTPEQAADYNQKIQQLAKLAGRNAFKSVEPDNRQLPSIPDRVIDPETLEHLLPHLLSLSAKADELPSLSNFMSRKFGSLRHIMRRLF